MKVSVRYMVLGPVQTNVYLVTNEETKHCVIIDPADKADYISEQMTHAQIIPDAILLTHGHFDHIGAVGKLQETYGAKELPVYAFCEEEELLEDTSLNQSIYYDAVTVRADHFLKDGDHIAPAGIPMQVLYTPGHTRGSCCYYLEEENLLFSGDTLFQRSVGRSDMPTGDEDTLVESIRRVLMALPDETNVLPGHGAPTTISYERAHNPYI